MKSPTMFHINKYNRGVSIAEMILALALFALLIPSSAMLIMSGYSAYGFAQQRHHHFVLAKSELDAYIAGHTFTSPFSNASSSRYVEDGIVITTAIIPRSMFAVQVSVIVVDTRLPITMQYRSRAMLSQIMVDKNYPNIDSCELYLSPA